MIVHVLSCQLLCLWMLWIISTLAIITMESTNYPRVHIVKARISCNLSPTTYYGWPSCVVCSVQTHSSALLTLLSWAFGNWISRAVTLVLFSCGDWLVSKVKLNYFSSYLFYCIYYKRLVRAYGMEICTYLLNNKWHLNLKLWIYMSPG